MMNENSFDRHIKDSLLNYKSPVPKGLWDKIEADKRLRKSVPFWKKKYFLSTVISIMAISLIVATLNKSANFKNNSNKSLSVNNLTQTTNSKISRSKYDNITTNHVESNSVVNNEASKNNELKNSEKNIAHNNSEKLSRTIDNASSKANITSHDNAKTSLKNTKDNMVESIKSNDKTQVVAGRHLAKVNRLQDSEKNLTANSVEAKSVKLVANLVKSVSNVIVSGKNKANISPLPSSPISSEVNSLDETNSYHLENAKIVTHHINLLSENVLDKNLMSPSNLTVIHVPAVVKKNWYLEGFVSPDYNTQSTKNKAELSSLSKTLDSSQRITNGFTIGARITRSIGNHWNIKSGLQFKQINERFAYIQESSKSVNVITNRSYIDNQGASVNVLDTVSYQQFGYTIKTVFNSYKSIEIPLTVGWEGNIDKLRLGINTGLITTLYTIFQGKTIDNSRNIIPLGATHTNGFYQSVPSFSLYGSAELTYPINNQIDAFAEPYYRLGLSDNINSAVGYNKRYNSAGVFFGLKYRISSTGIK